MASRVAKRRDAMAASLAESAELFYPERRDQFLCPTCLTWVALSDRSNITDGHIIPQAAGGQATTVLCRKKCNSPFGSKRDKWLGEYIKLVRKPQPHMLNADEQLGYFEIDGVRVSGDFRIAEDGKIQFFVWKSHTSPMAMAALAERFEGPVYDRPRSCTIRYPAPRLFRNVDAVEIGFITAAYLMWFRALGYAWVLQRHLDIVRRQIATEALTVLPRSASVVITGGDAQEPSIGIASVDGEMALVCAIEDRLVFFPPADNPDLYGKLPRTMEGKSTEVYLFSLGRKLRQDLRQLGPFGVLFEGRLIVWPDVLFSGKYPLLVLAKDQLPRVMTPVSEDEFQRLKERYPTLGIELDVHIERPKVETGR